MRRDIVIVIPAARPTGPVKGAYALANALVGQRRVTMVTLRAGPGAEAPLDPAVTMMSLAEHRGFRARLSAYRALLENIGGPDRIATISMCFSADLLNAYAGRQAFTCASVRGNLMENYRTDYGLAGFGLAVLHYRILRRFDRVMAMTIPMARQVLRLAGRNASVIGNFLDEAALDGWRLPAGTGGPLRFVFLGQLSPRKDPLLAIHGIAALRAAGEECRLDIVGDGMMRDRVVAEIARLELSHLVKLHGFLPSPYAILAGADALLLPSVSEGISRAAMEALYLGVPCILRDRDGNGELIRPGWNGALFHKPEELAPAMMQTARMARDRATREILLPEDFRQKNCAAACLAAAEGER